MMESRKTNLLGILFSICVILVLSVGLTIALHSITPTSANVNEDVFRLYNITVNNTGVLTADGITQVNITVPPTFLFLDGSNGTNAGAPTFTNTSTVLSWSNASGTAMVANITFNYFFFNASASTPGTFNITLTTSNSTYTSFSNISVSVNDTTSPSAITFVSPSESAGANLSRNKTGFNITATDNGVVDSVRVYLYNATSLVNNTNVSGAFAYVNFTGLADGTYSVNASGNDSAGNTNQTSEIRTFMVDTIKPLIDYGTGTAVAGANLSQTFVYVNVTVTETNDANITFNIYNTTSLVNSTLFTNSQRTINWTGLAINVTYTYNVTVVDLVGNINVTATRLITLDTTVPSAITFVSPSESAGANLSRNKTGFNITATDNGVVDSVRVYLYNATSLVNNTNVSGAFAYVNFTGLADGAYSVNATANDTFGNINQTSEIRRFTVDTINPLVDYGTGTAAAGANLSQTFVYVNVSLTETNEANISFALYNATSLVNLTNYTTSVRTINWTGLAANVTYTYNVTVVDLVGHTNVTATRLITFDTTKPLISFTGATDVDGANFSTRTNVYVNVSVTETNEKNITFYLYNTTVLVNSTAYITGVRTINWTGLSNNSIYTYNVTIFDYAGNSNTTSTRTITFDNVAPSIQYVNPSTADGSSPEQSYIRVNVTVSDTNYVRNISISLFNSTGGLIVSNSSASSPSSFYIEFPNLVVGIYYVNASANDSSGNINFTSSRTVSLINNTTPSSSSSGSSSGGSSAKKDFWSNTYVYDNQEFSQTGSLTRLLGKTERVRVKVDGVLHHVGVTAVNGNQVVINTSSVSQQETINIGDSAKFELTGDSYYDLLIKINSIMSGKANLTISSIHELKQVVPLVSPPINENTPEPTANPAPILESPQTSKDVSSALIWVIVLIVVLVIIGIILYKHRWKKKNPFYQFY